MCIRDRVTDQKIPHSGRDDGNCTTAVICECGAVITPAKDAHELTYTSNHDGTDGASCENCNFSQRERCADVYKRQPLTLCAKKKAAFESRFFLFAL